MSGVTPQTARELAAPGLSEPEANGAVAPKHQLTRISRSYLAPGDADPSTGPFRAKSHLTSKNFRLVAVVRRR
jgi:hypothetical protein